MNNNLKKLYTLQRRGSLFAYIVKSICLAALLSNSAGAAVWLFDPTITLSQGYEDNYRLSSDSSNEDEIWTTKLSGHLALKGKSERLDVKTVLRLDAINYNGDDSDLNERNNQLMRLASTYRVTERNLFFLKGDIFRDSILRRTRFLIDPQDTGDGVTFDPDLDVDENLVRENIRRTRTFVNPGWNYRLNESTNVGLYYVYRDLSFSGASSTNLVESDSQTVIASISRRVSEKDRVTGSISESYFRPDNNLDVDTLAVTLGWVHDFSESFQMDFKVGGRDSDFKNTQSSNDSGFVAKVGATKRTGLATYRVGYERNVSPSASGNQIEFDEFLFDFNRRLTEKLTFVFNGSYLDTDSTEGTTSNSDRKLTSLRPGLRWRFQPSWVASAFYKYEENDRDIGGSGHSNSATINISWSPPRQF